MTYTIYNKRQNYMEKYKNKIVETIMKDINAYLIKQYGGVNKEWEVGLLLLADNIDLYLECKKVLKKEGIFDSEYYRKNPILSTLKDLHSSIIKELTHYGVTPYSSTKIGNLNDNAEDSDLLKNLMGLDEE